MNSRDGVRLPRTISLHTIDVRRNIAVRRMGSCSGSAASILESGDLTIIVIARDGEHWDIDVRELRLVRNHVLQSDRSTPIGKTHDYRIA
jgi:hypothetical protein